MSEYFVKSKETNTFRFKSFSDRINEIDIRQSTLYRIGHENEELEEAEDETLFAQTLRKWSVLNLSTEYSGFLSKCRGIVTLPQLLYKKDEVAELLANTLDSCSVLSLEPVLDALVAFARDIREEFHPYFEKFFEKLIHLLNTQEADQLEWSFRCLAHLFKCLRPFLKRNIGVILNKVIPLLDVHNNPEHIVAFASECFSFVARDIRDYDKFLSMTIRYVKKQAGGYSGCGKLFFELIRGVAGNFHSVAKDFLNSLLGGLGNRKYDQEILLEITVRTVSEVLEHIAVHNISLLWEVIKETAMKLLEKSDLPTEGLFSLMKLVRQAVEWKGGRAVVDASELVGLLVKVVENVENEAVLMELIEISSTILQSACVKLQQMDASRLICRVLSVRSPSVYEKFVWNVCTHPQFEILVLPNLLNYFEKDCDAKKLDIVVQIIEKRVDRPVGGVWKKHPVKLKRAETFNWLERNIEVFDPKTSNETDLELYLLSVRLYPHLIGGKGKLVAESLRKKVPNLRFTLEDDIVASATAFVSIEAVLHLSDSLEKRFLEDIVYAVIDSPCKSVPVLLVLLSIFDYSKANKQDIFTKELYLRLQQNTCENLSSTDSTVRSLTAKLLSYFSDLKELQSVYKIFYEAAGIELTVHTFREQLLLIEKLSPNGQVYKDIKIEAAKLDCLRFLLGLLYQNFKLMWAPVSKSIEELADKLPVDDFWSIYRSKLEETNASIRTVNSVQNVRTAGFKSKSLCNLVDQLFPMPEKVDFGHYRTLLWKNISNFGLMSEIKNKDVVTLFLSFVEDEYKKEDKGNLLTWDVTHESGGICEYEDDSSKKFQGRNKKQQSTGATLTAMLEVFSKMANPKQLYREGEIREFYFVLLAGTNEQLQKLALDCLMRYKMKGWLPYKDHLYALIDDKKFKDELVNFKLDVETKMIEPDHRGELMPILLRILYGKMRSKTSNKYVGSQMRRSIVLRFLAGCKTDEIFWFLQMAFESYKSILQESLESIPNLIKSGFKLQEVYSPKKLRSALNLLELIRKHFGGLMGSDFLIYMLKVIFLAASVCRGVFENKEKMNEKYLAVFRNLRAQSLSSLVNFFDHFQEFPWQEEHLSACLDVFVWPTLHKLPEDCLHSPTPLLKLFIAWSNNLRLFRLLAKENEDGVTPIGTMLLLLASDKPTAMVRRAVLEIVERILMMEESEEADNKKGAKSIIAQHIPLILERLTKTLNMKGRKNVFGKAELFILSKITDMELAPDTCDKLLKLILPIATGKTRLPVSEESSTQLVMTLKNLFSKVPTPEKHIRSIMPLFEKVTDVGTRKQLCRLLGELSIKAKSESGSLLELGEIAEKLNAWSRKWVEQPDYDKRLSALRTIRGKIENDEVSLELGLLVIYNCFYFLHHDKDLGLRDNACLCMRSLVPKLINQCAENARDVNYLVEDVLFSLLRRTQRDKNDIIRNEGILLLGEMVRNCAHVHPVLGDLEPLSCREDPEVDFFENATHLQLHRHGRALLKFCAHAKECEKSISPRTLTQFLLPLATRYLLSEKTAAKHTLVDAAIETVGMICRFLPWHQYHAILRYYLQKMRHCHEYQKQCIRIIISILDAFHFDLSNGSCGKKQEVETNEQAQEENEDELSDEDLDSELDDLHEHEDGNEDGEQNIVPAKKLKLAAFVDHLTKLPPSTAKHVIETITTRLIPSLNNSITKISSYESKHKVNRRRVNFEREEEESLRVPIALAIVKLLKKLPQEMLDASINGVFLKVCTFLKSPVKSVRMLTRDILKKIMVTVGAEYLPVLLSQLTVLLTRGFQVHVLSVTLFSVLDCLKSELQAHQVEKSLQYILNVTLNDIFGDASEEKEVEKIGASTPEAKPSAKSYLSLQISAQSIPQNCLLDLLVPFKHYLSKTQSKKVVIKVQGCFQKITSGLAENTNITPETLVEFIYGTVSESIPDLLLTETKLSQAEKELAARSRKDCFLIPQEPKSRSGAVRKVVKTNASANAYILIEFGLELLHILLRRKKFESSEYLEPIIPILNKSLKSAHVRICTFALKCLISIWLSDSDLDAMKQNMDEILQQIFALLHKYYNFGVTRKDDNFQLVKSAMKAVGCVIKNCDYYIVSNEHVVELLFYISQDVSESDKQPVAFSLLKSLIEKRMYSHEMHEIMQKLCQIAIVSESDYSRDEARAVLLNYVAEFHREKKVESILKFFIAQLNYEVLAGRLSAVRFIESSIKKYPMEALNRKAEVLFLALGTRLVNEDVPECRVLIANCLEQLISRLDKANRQKLFEIAMVFFEGGKPAVQEMAACLCSRFIEVEKAELLPKAMILLPVLGNHLELSSPNTAGKFVKTSIGADTDLDESQQNGNDQATQRAVDHAIIQIQNCMIKIFTNCMEILTENSMINTLDDIAYECQRLLAYDHEWVRLNSVKILNYILPTCSVSFPNSESETPEDTSRHFICSDPPNELRSLTLDLCAQMVPGEVNAEFANEISKSLLYIANIVRSLHDETNGTNLHWLLRRIRYVIHGEVAKAPKSIVLRESLFDWIEGMVALLDGETLLGLCPGMIASLIREISEDDVNVDTKIKQKAIKITNKIRKKIGDENYDKIRLASQTKLLMKRAARKKELAQEKILDPVRSAKRKSSQQERKKAAKRRKIDEARGKSGILRKKKKRMISEDIF
ncbi:unnamed protein product [Hermetia illucens]|uniref:Small subunit processome component 20 homolog n=1 Tax=Hermetia illucens TaxID=343691 RepID=A0A7R8U9G6_HERIL|nr:small subunit processome component 20 homolog [Hermetia illucens]CAD7076634.1 unnamed protein product [Hermetia illucens]